MKCSSQKKIELPISLSPKSLILDFISFLNVRRRYSPHTLSSYKRDLLLFHHFTEESTAPLSDVTFRTCKQFLYHLQTKDYHPKSIARIIAAHRSFWTYLIAEKHCQTNPWTMLTLPKIKKSLPNVLPTDSLLTFLDNMPADTPISIRNKCIAALLYSTGMRVSECVNLTLDQIDFDQQEIRLSGKGKKERLVFMDPVTKDQCATYFHHVRPTLAAQPSNAFFINKSGKGLTSRAIQRFLKAESERQELPFSLTPHMLRHAFATDLYRGGADIRSIQELLGHNQLTSTEIYTNLSSKERIDAYHKSFPKDLGLS